MEDVLDLYHEEYDRECPVVCFDESSKQLLGDVRPPIEAAPGRVERYDTEYQRNGTRNLFMFCEPKGGWRHVEVTGRRTAVDFAQQMKWLVDEAYPDATLIRLVLDNLNTHKPGSLYEAFAPSEARRIAKRLELHYTPKHGSWLNMAEIEFSVFSRQCLNRRVGDEALLRREIAALEHERNKAAAIIDWRFSTQDARSKLKHVYPIELNCGTRCVFVPCGYGGSPGPILGLDFLPCRTACSLLSGASLVSRQTCSQAGFGPRMTSESSECLNRHHSSHLCPLWRFLRQIGYPFSALSVFLWSLFDSVVMCRPGSLRPTVLNKKPASAVLAGWFWMDWSFIVFYGIDTSTWLLSPPSVGLQCLYAVDIRRFRFSGSAWAAVGVFRRHGVPSLVTFIRLRAVLARERCGWCSLL